MSRGATSSQPFDVIEKAEIVLHLHVPEVVPVADVRNVEFVEHFEHFGLARNLLEAVPALDAEPRMPFSAA